MPKSSPLQTLDPFIDAQGLLRVGGRLYHSSLNQSEKFPLIIPGSTTLQLFSLDTTMNKSTIKAVTSRKELFVQLAFG